MQEKVRSYKLSVPATSGNLGPGFDRFGLAYTLRMEIIATPASSWLVTHMGEGADGIAHDESNLIVASYLKGAELLGYEPETFHLQVNNLIPISRGLGSSATAIVVGLGLAQLVHSGGVDKDLLFTHAANYEGHPDNVAPAIYGGLCLCGSKDGAFTYEPGELHPDIKILLLIPNDKTSTSEMRGILPKSYDPAVLAHNREAQERLLEGLAKADPDLLKYSEEDRMHQPYRLEAQPFSKKLYEMLQAHKEIPGVFLSGSGPTIAGWRLGAPLDFEHIDGVRLLQLDVDLNGLIWETANN